MPRAGGEADAPRAGRIRDTARGSECAMSRQDKRYSKIEIRKRYKRYMKYNWKGCQGILTAFSRFREACEPCEKRWDIHPIVLPAAAESQFLSVTSGSHLCQPF